MPEHHQHPGCEPPYRQVGSASTCQIPLLRDIPLPRPRHRPDARIAPTNRNPRRANRRPPKTPPTAGVTWQPRGNSPKVGQAQASCSPVWWPLDARRAAEEKAGHSRWLRPDFQNPVTGNTLLNKELITYTGRGLQANLALETPEKHKKPTKTRANSQTSLAEPEVKVWGDLSFPSHNAQDLQTFVKQILIHEK